MQTAKQVENPLKELRSFGQSVWLDYIRRNLLTSGELDRLVREDGLMGMTSNPSIFEKAIAGSTDYTEQMDSLKGDRSLDAKGIYERIAIEDIQRAADALRPVYKETAGVDGYVSIEVSPLLAHDTQGTIAEAKRLWQSIDRPNIMIKVPGTREGIPAFEHLIAHGINVNVTLLFAQKRYEEIAEAYIRGLEELDRSGGDISRIASVASFFISRIDTMIDSILEDKVKAAKNPDEEKKLKGLIGKIAIANGKLTYQKYLEICQSDRFKKLASKGAKPQRLLWASTSTKNPAYPDTIYVDELIGKETVNTIPPATFDAFRDHGNLRNSLVENIEDARKQMSALKELNISMDEVTQKLEDQGVKLFADAFEQLLETVEKARTQKTPKLIDRISYKLPADLEKTVNATLSEWHSQEKMKRLWSRDSSLWTNQDENKWLDWLNIISDQLSHIENLKKIAQAVKQEGFKHAVVLGMGGSSLCPEVMAITFGQTIGYPELHVLDSTDPQQIRTLEKKLDLKSTVFIVSSKSGSTLEPNIFEQYFYNSVVEAVGKEKAGQHFIAVTDPGSKLEKAAQDKKFRQIFQGVPGIGGRYSALSNFGMVPSAVMGVDIDRLLAGAQEMALACALTVPVKENPGAVLGIILGAASMAGKDKATFITSPAIYDLGAWLEQLLAESTGKRGKAIIPVDRETPASPDKYGSDRLFVYLRLQKAFDAHQDKIVDELEKSGQAVVRISVPDIYALGQEFFLWEIATAVAGAVMSINPFDQPDVEASKVATRELTSAYEETGKLPSEEPIFESDGIKLFTDGDNGRALAQALTGEKSLEAYLKAHLGRIKDGDYFGLLAYIEMNEANERALQNIRHQVRDARKVATCLGFGPRFLHSTGQAYKGGPNTGVFLQITQDDASDLKVPGQKYTFGIVKSAQARGDLKVLQDRKRRVLRVHLGKDSSSDLNRLISSVEKALS